MNRDLETGDEQGVAASSIQTASVSEYSPVVPSYSEGDMGPLVPGDAAPASDTERTMENRAVPSSDAHTGDTGDASKAVVGDTCPDKRKGDEEDYTKILADYLETIATESASDHSYTVSGGEPLALSTALGAGRNYPPKSKSTASRPEGSIEGRKPNQPKQEEHQQKPEENQQKSPSVPQETNSLAPPPTERPVVQPPIPPERAAPVSDPAPSATVGATSSAPPPSQPLASAESQPVPGGPKRCTRRGCPNPAIESRDWDNEYCSSECVLAHCKDVFNAWVTRRQQVAAGRVAQ